MIVSSDQLEEVEAVPLHKRVVLSLVDQIRRNYSAIRCKKVGLVSIHLELAVPGLPNPLWRQSVLLRDLARYESINDMVFYVLKLSKTGSTYPNFQVANVDKPVTVYEPVVPGPYPKPPPLQPAKAVPSNWVV